MRPTIEIVANEFAKLFGPAETAKPADVAVAAEPGPWGSQIIYPLAFMYLNDENPWCGNEVLIEMVRGIGEYIFDLGKDPGLFVGLHRRTYYPLCHAFRLLKDRLQDTWREKVILMVQEGLIPQLRERERLTIFTSANVGYGTNHLAIELSGLTAFIQAFADDPVLEEMAIEGVPLEQYTRNYLARFMAYMDEGGYWAECDGPAQIYNSLSANSLLRAAIDLGEVETYRKQFEAAATYHVYHQLPNLKTTGVTDGRNRQSYVSSRISFCGFTPEGHSMLDAIRDENLALSRCEAKAFSGEALNELLTDITAEAYFAPAAPVIWTQERYAHTIRDDFGVIKRGPWIAAFSNFEFRPRPEGHWNLDYQNLFSLYHERFGIVFSGSNGKNDPELATFSKLFHSFDNSPIDPPMWKYIPGEGQFEIHDHGFTVTRDYRGFEGIVELESAGPDRAEVRFSANARRGEYPIMCTLQPAAGFGRGFRDARGRAYDVTEESFSLTGGEMGNALILTPEERPSVMSESKGVPIRISLPDNAEIVWPYKGWDCYNLQTDRYEEPASWSLILRLPVGEDGAKIEVTTTA